MKKRSTLLRFLFIMAALLLLNIIAYYFYGRFDLTREKRFTLTPATKNLLRNLDDVVYVKVYLEGEFPAGFKRLRNSTQEMLDEMRSYAGGMLEYEFTDPMADSDAKEREAIAQQLMDKGLQPTRLIENTEDYSEKIIFPGAIISYKGRDLPTTLLQEQLNKTPEETLDNSINLLEYNLANTIQKIQAPTKPSIAFLEGHGELAPEQIEDFAFTLSKYYILKRFNLKDKLYIPSQEFMAVVIAKPTQKFEETEKYKLDQYIMSGGKVLWMLENLNTNLDSLQSNNGAFIATDYGLNLEDQLFRYGARVNFDVVQDMQCNQIPLAVGIDQFGNAQNMQLFPWNYYPVITNYNPEHPVSKNMDAVMLQFAGSIDTIAGKNNSNVQKTILLSSSKYSNRVNAPVKINVNDVRQKPDPAKYPDKNIPVAVALEGEFESIFKNRLAFSTQAMVDTLSELKFKDHSKNTRMVVISDGDFCRNEIDPKTGKATPLGYYKYTRETFANKDFLLNIIEWLTDENGIIAARSKEIKTRLLDEQRVKQEKFKWQLINTLLPIGMVLAFAAIFGWWRRKKYAK
jgi:ABC-2 type transport system permease protein